MLPISRWARTASGLDITGALVGERWRIGDALLEVCSIRIPCRTFAGWLQERGWIKRFTRRAVCGAYLRVLEPGQVRAGVPIVVESRPDHDVTVGVTFRALTNEPELLPRLLVADALVDEAREKTMVDSGAEGTTECVAALLVSPPPAGWFVDRDDDSLVQQAIQQRGGEHRSAQSID